MDFVTISGIYQPGKLVDEVGTSELHDSFRHSKMKEVKVECKFMYLPKRNVFWTRRKFLNSYTTTIISAVKIVRRIIRSICA